MQPMLQATGLGVRYEVRREQARSLIQLLADTFRRKRSATLWALRGIDVEILRGEVLAIIGRNGAGKTTLLKTLAGILEPTEGTVQVHGSVATLIELGAGFHAELSGRENLYLSGSMVGLGRREMDRRVDRILEFAELQEFADVAVKNYSSGMYMRLGFSFAVDIDPDVFFIDEVLAVGDEAFQKKCYDKLASFWGGGKTIVLVSHDLGAVRRLSTRACVLEGGRMAFDGPPVEAIDYYRKAVSDRPSMGLVAPLEVSKGSEGDRGLAGDEDPESDGSPAGDEGWPEAPGHTLTERELDEAAAARTAARGAGAVAVADDGPEPEIVRSDHHDVEQGGPIRIEAVRFLDGQRCRKTRFSQGRPFVARLVYDTREPVRDPVFGIAIYRAEDWQLVTGPNSRTSGVRLGVLRGRGAVDLVVDALPLVPGRYLLFPAVFDADGETPLFGDGRLYAFEVEMTNGATTAGAFAMQCDWEHRHV